MASKYSYPLDTGAMMSSLRPMPRPIKDEGEKFPKHVVINNSIKGEAGITVSVEEQGGTKDGSAELEVLKAILNREGYLNRLKQVARTVGKKFKPEVADVLDFVRASSLDVIDMIIRWREVKKDHDAAFMWNGVNYLLKMPSDLDYLADYLAIKRWVGFPLVRNPFCVPYPLEDGQALLTEAGVISTEAGVNPKHLEKGLITDGFVLGGMSRRTLHKAYAAQPSPEDSHTGTAQYGLGKRLATDRVDTANTASTFDSEQEQSSRSQKVSPYLTGAPASVIAASKIHSEPKVVVASSAAQSFVFNEQMSKIRQAELVILAEERKFGVLAKDPEGRLMPRLQALTRQAAHELKKDDLRPLSEPAQTASYAPHAANSDIGLAPPSWTPAMESAAAAELAAGGTKRRASVGNTANSASLGALASAAAAAEVDGAHPNRSSARSQRNDTSNLYSEAPDPTLQAVRRGQGKVGGLLAPLQTKGAQTRRHRPLKTTLTSEMEFNRTRQIRTLSEKIEEINRLRQSVNEEKRKLEEQLADKAAELHQATLKPLSAEGVDLSRKQRVVKSAASNHTYGTEPPPSYTDIIGEAKGGSSTKSPTATMRKSGSARFAPDSGATSPSVRARSPLDASPSLSRQGSLKRQLSSGVGSSRNMSDTADSPSTSAKQRAPSPNGSPAMTRQTSGRKFLSPLQDADRSPSPSPAQTRHKQRSNSITRTQFAEDVTVYEESQFKERITEEAKVISQGIVAKGEELRRLHTEEIHARQKLSHSVQDEGRIFQIKSAERGQKNRELSRDIERKRRLLAPKDGVRLGPPPEDPANMYDYYAIKVQSTIRGFLARCWIKWFRAMSIKAAVILQSAMRGWFGRMRVRRIRKYYNAARVIQKNFRGWSTRGTSAAMAKKKNFGRSAVTIQRLWRGILGRRRAVSKRALDKAARMAFEVVDARVLIVSDVKELARRILYAIEEPSTTSFPPDEVLHLIRLSVLIIQAARGQLGIAEYDFFNARNYDEVDGENLTWLQAAKMVNRAERFMRLVRLMAYGPGAKPPRLVQLPNAANLLYAAQALNPRWHINTFESMGMGSKICVQLFKWLSSIIEVAARQQEFLALIASSFPDWLPKLHDFQKSARAAEMEIELNKKCLQVLSVFRSQAGEDETLLSVLDEETVLVRRAEKDGKIRMRSALHEMEKLKDDQSSREVFALEAMEKKVMENQEQLDDLVLQYHDAVQQAAAGERAAIEALPDLRHRLTNQRLKVTELDGQRKILQNQVEANRLKRKDPARLTPEIMLKTQVAGEEKAAYVVAQVRKRTMLQSAGVKHAEDLPLHLMDVYEELEHEEAALKAQARKALVEAENERKVYDDYLGRSMAANELKEQKAKDKMAPSDQELQEERFEDERHAVEERTKHRQYLPDSVLHSGVARPRPVVIALSRDLSGYSKRRLHAEVTRLLPGLFVSLNHEGNMGIDSHAMQSILDCGKCVVMEVDPGLTRLTRDTFLQALEITTDALIPKPFVAIAVGDEDNKRGGSGPAGSYHGVEKHDLLHMLKDGRIKGAMEGKAWVIQELQRAEVRLAIQERSMELVPPSPAFGFVTEALFVALSANDVYKSPDPSLAAMSWRVTRTMLVEPRHVVEKMKQMRRGAATLKAVECLQCYLDHPHWPAPYSTERSTDPVLHLFAYFVEQYVQCEKGCRAGGGVPLQALTKSSMRGIQTVVVVRDTAETPEEADALVSAGWKMSALRLVRTALQDMRVLKQVMKIDSVLYTISVYRDCGNLYFEAYDPANSDVHMAVVALDDVPSLLVPNAFTAGSNVNLDPPQSPHAMYVALCKLLRFEKSLDGRQKTLICRRELTFLGNLTRKISGHMVLLKSYEAALGELYFNAYMPEFSAHLTLLIDAPMRLAMQQNADKGDTKESENVCLEDARPLLPFMLDRLRVFPSKAMVLAKGIDLNDGFRKNQGLQSTLKRQGFLLTARLHGGVGRILQRKIVRFYDVLHVVEVRVSGPTQILDLMIYEPRMQHRMNLRMSKFMRRVLLGSVSDDLRQWYQELMRRVRLDWRGEHAIRLDYSIFTAVRRICGQRVVVKFSAVDETCITVSLLMPALSETFVATLTKVDVIRILLYESPAARVQRQNGTAIFNPVVHGILQDMRQVLSAPDEQVNERSHPALFEKGFDYYLTDRAKLTHLAEQLVLVVTLVDRNRPQRGFEAKGYPLTARFEAVDRREQTKEDLNMALRTNSWFTPKPCTGTYEDLVRSRRQYPVLHMEEALNAMALEKSKQAAARTLAVLETAAQVQRVMEETKDPEELADAIEDATGGVADDLLDTIHGRMMERFAERNAPGYMQSKHELELAAAMEERARREEEEAARRALVTEEDRAIVGDVWKDVFEAGVKVHYREVKVRWQGHVSVKVASAPCWLEEDGMGRRYRFTVYEPNVAQHFEGFIRSRKHLREILGLHGQDLLDISREREMILFVSRFRMDVVVNKKTWDGVEVEPDAPPYRIEFQSDRMFGTDKVTPVNAAAEEDEEFNKAKLMTVDNARGQKIIRLVRRVSGLLMQLTVFELPSTVAEAAYAITKAQLTASAAVAAAADVAALANNRPQTPASPAIISAPGTTREPVSEEGELVVREATEQDEEATEAAAAAGSIQNQGQEAEAEAETEMGETVNATAASAEELADIELRKGFVEQRLRTTVLERYPPPAFRIVGYDPKSKRKLTLGVEPQAIIEVAGGVFSPYLDPGRRKELARIVCDSLVLVFPSGKAFELLVPWSGAKKEVSTAVVSKTEGKATDRSGAERVLKRPGRLFRSALRISKYELLVSVYSHVISLAADTPENSDNRQLIFNFYSPAVSEAAEVVVSETEQTERLGRPVLHFGEGSQRAVAIRRLCKFFRAEIIVDIMDPQKKTLAVVLLPPEKGYLGDYQQVSPSRPGEEIRPVGIPGVFFPLDTCGKPLHREGMSLPNRDRSKPPKDFLVTVYTKSPQENAERGLVIKLYDRSVSETAILHVGASELIRICSHFDEPDLLRDLVTAQAAEDSLTLDDIERGFSELTAKGDLHRKTQALVSRLMHIVLGDLGYYISPQDTVVPYIRSGPRGIFPS